jgi:hypothetical protein
MNKQEILKKLEDLIPESDYSGDMMLCLNTKDNYPNVYPSVDINQIPQMIGKVQAYGTAVYTKHLLAVEQYEGHMRILKDCKPEDKKDIVEMLELFTGKKYD